MIETENDFRFREKLICMLTERDFLVTKKNGFSIDCCHMWLLLLSICVILIIGMFIILEMLRGHHQ